MRLRREQPKADVDRIAELLESTEGGDQTMVSVG